jgi:hypothetical protein
MRFPNRIVLTEPFIISNFYSSELSPLENFGFCFGMTLSNLKFVLTINYVMSVRIANASSSVSIGSTSLLSLT